MKRNGLVPAIVALIAGTTASTFAQSNTDPQIDVKLGALDSLTVQARTGTFPGGMNGLAMATTSCNIGTKDVPWLAAMQADHPFIAFMVVRERGQRMIQISDYSFCKHGFFALSNNQCNTCQHPSPQGTWLGVGCSDTYGTSNNGDSYWLGPPAEIDPWLGTWNPNCSHFDKGEPPVASPQDCDGSRSLTQGMINNLGPIAHKMKVKDSDLNVPGTFYYQGQYVIRTEGENKRGDNVGSKRFTPTWSSGQNKWNITTNDSSITYGSVLQRWSGASVTSNTNGGDDGRVYVAVKVYGPTNGIYHYEYALHNRDNKRGISAFHLPISQCVTITNVGFEDVDDDVNNSWTLSQSATEAVFSNPANPLRWNSIYNIYFDSNAAPSTIAMNSVLDEADAGTGAPSFVVLTTAPSNIPFSNFGTGTPGCNGEHHVCANSAPYIGNANFQLLCDNAPASSLGLGIATDVPLLAGGDQFGLGITLYNDLILSTQVYSFDLASDANGLGVAPAPIANDVNLVGLTFYVDALWAWTGGPCSPSPLGLSSSNAMQVTVTN